MPEQSFQAAAAALLSTWSAVTVRRNDAPPIDGGMVNLYAEALESIDATLDELKAIRLGMVKRSKFFPTVAEVVAAIEEGREEAKTARRRERWSAMVPCVDSAGASYVAPFWAVGDDGVLLPDGEKNPNALHPREREAMERDGRLALPAPERPLSDEERRERILALAERSGLPAAAYMVAVLNGDAPTQEERDRRTLVERNALKENRERLEALDAEREKKSGAA